MARTYALESLVICSFLRGLSVRDVEAALAETFEEPVIGKSTVARVCQDTRERYRRWCERRLEEHDLVYLFLDALYLKLRPDDEPAEGVLVAWGVTLEGRKVLLGLALGQPRELRELARVRPRPRRSRAPLAGADRRRRRARAVEGRARAVADRRGTALHRARTPERHRQAARAPPPRHQGPLVAASSTTPASPADARRGLEAIVADYRTAYPSAMAVIERDLDALVAHLRWPSEHRKRIRSTNLLERTFVEVRRRTKVIGRFPGETSALSLIWAVLELTSRGWRGVVMTPRSVAEIERLRRRQQPPAPPRR